MDRIEGMIALVALYSGSAHSNVKTQQLNDLPNWLQSMSSPSPIFYNSITTKVTKSYHVVDIPSHVLIL